MVCRYVSSPALIFGLINKEHQQKIDLYMLRALKASNVVQYIHDTLKGLLATYSDFPEPHLLTP